MTTKKEPEIPTTTTNPPLSDNLPLTEPVKPKYTMPLIQGTNKREPPVETRIKPGEVRNPKGRPPNLLSRSERLSLLSGFAKRNKKKANPIEAIRVINEMEGDNAPVKHDFSELTNLLSSLRGYQPQLPRPEQPQIEATGDDNIT